MMTELGNPEIRLSPKSFEKFVYRTDRQIFLPPPSQLPKCNFFSTISERRSRRKFLKLSTAELSNVLWFTCKTFEANQAEAAWQHRCTPSAGGIHPIDVLISTPAERRRNIYIYEPFSHSLRLVSGIKVRPLQRLLSQVNEIVPVGDGTLIWFVAQFQKTLSRYKHGESLVWRDSGALLANLCIVSEAFSLNCCAIGATGNPHIQNIFNEPEKLRGVGGCVIGARSKSF